MLFIIVKPIIYIMGEKLIARRQAKARVQVTYKLKPMLQPRGRKLKPGERKKSQ